MNVSVLEIFVGLYAQQRWGMRCQMEYPMKDEDALFSRAKAAAIDAYRVLSFQQIRISCNQKTRGLISPINLKKFNPDQVKDFHLKCIPFLQQSGISC